MHWNDKGGLFLTPGVFVVEPLCSPPCPKCWLQIQGSDPKAPARAAVYSAACFFSGRRCFKIAVRTNFAVIGVPS